MLGPEFYERDGGVSFACWPAGFLVGLWGLWERGKPRKLALVGMLMNVVVPPVGLTLWFFFVHYMLARSMGP